MQAGIKIKWQGPQGTRVYDITELDDYQLRRFLESKNRGNLLNMIFHLVNLTRGVIVIDDEPTNDESTVHDSEQRSEESRGTGSGDRGDDKEVTPSTPTASHDQDNALGSGA